MYMMKIPTLHVSCINALIRTQQHSQASYFAKLEYSQINRMHELMLSHNNIRDKEQKHGIPCCTNYSQAEQFNWGLIQP